MSEPSNSSEIACSLTDDEFRKRRAMARKYLIPHIIKTERLDSGLRLSFRETDALRSRVDTFVNLERQCCDFLTFAVTPPDRGLSVTIQGPPEAQATLEMFAASLTKNSSSKAKGYIAQVSPELHSE